MTTWHKLRKRIHLLCVLIFIALPFFNFMRFDIPRERFYFFGKELWINEFAIIFFALMFLMFVIVLSSVFYGRIYCGYLCPQMIFSEASDAIDAWFRKRITKRFPTLKPPARARIARVLWLAVVGAGSVFLAFIFISYFVEPRDLLRRLASLDLHTAGGISGAAVTLVTFLDFTLVKQKFCTTVCPYGYLQGLLGDDRTLLVHYRDPGEECIDCKKCVRVCPMGIDIRTSPFQIECIHCADCIDACGDIMARLKKPNLIRYGWGVKGEPWRWTGRRVVVAAILLAYAGGLTFALTTRRPVLVRISPVRETLYRKGDDGRIYNRFRYQVANRGAQPDTVAFSIRNLPGAQLVSSANPVRVEAGKQVTGEFEIARPVSPGEALVTHFEIAAGSDRFPMTFLAPSGDPK
ncbi:MAG: 4Fe-4S binding protein [Acidobacteria bacterium]|nr:4Fe-4S binding protein [Acidobacteriota bacterium]